jgi:GNAT superfamily N-acetyltransferase
VIFTTHRLADGTRARLRLTRPTDTALVQAFLEDAPDAAVRHFTHYEPRERLMMAALVFADGGEQIVGLADVAFVGTGLAEIGVVVRDDTQGQGLGKLLSEAVASIAVQRGATRLKGEEPMLPLLERLGHTVRTVEDGRALAYTRLSRAPRSRRRRAA